MRDVGIEQQLGRCGLFETAIEFVLLIALFLKDFILSEQFVLILLVLPIGAECKEYYSTQENYDDQTGIEEECL